MKAKTQSAPTEVHPSASKPGAAQPATHILPKSFSRVVIEGVHPEIDCGRFPIKRSVGEEVEVEADIHADGHDVLVAVLRYRFAGTGPAVPCGPPTPALPHKGGGSQGPPTPAVFHKGGGSQGPPHPGPPPPPTPALPHKGGGSELHEGGGSELHEGGGSELHERGGSELHERGGSDAHWHEAPMQPLGNDRWVARFTVEQLGRYEYTLQAWVDRFGSWRRDLAKKFEAAQDVASELLEGAQLVAEAAERASGSDAERLRRRAAILKERGGAEAKVHAALDPELEAAMLRYSDRRGAADYGKVLSVTVEPERARYGAWYEMFPRSCAPEPGRHGTFKDAEARLPYIKQMGFDVLYLPPIHPIGKSFRKGPNNTLVAGPDDPGSPWAIGSEAGGHKSVHPELGTIDDFDRFVAAAQKHGIEIALDVAFQCSPDHPYVREHPEWFRRRPDGTVKYAENPPKKYQDIYPPNFECDAWPALWEELKSVFSFWIEHGVKIFRVDNPHTKPFRFWEWVIAAIKRDHPDTIFLSEAFTRPKVMKHLAKAGFSQSYTYFTWRNTKAELVEYLTELTQTEVREYLRPNFFANTPDILHEYLQFGGRAAFMARLVLAATMGASYGIYGPAFELCEGRAVPGTEEYLDSEKYEIRHWQIDSPQSIREFVARVNQIRRENWALHDNWNLRFYPVDNEQLLFYGKATRDLGNIILVVVNLDPRHTQHGWVRVPLEELKLDPTMPFQVHDLLSDSRHLWSGETNFVQLNPHVCPAHVFRVRRRIKTERDFDYFM